MEGGSAQPIIPAGSFAWRVTAYREFGWSASQIDEIMARGWEAQRLSVYFEEVGAYEYKEMKKSQTSSNSHGSNETTDFVLEDQTADVWTPDDEEYE